MDESKKSVNFTVVPDEDSTVPRIYSNFCSIQNSPFDFTLTFCEMLPLGERELNQAQADARREGPRPGSHGGPGPDAPRPHRRPSGELPPLPGVLRTPKGPLH